MNSNRKAAIIVGVLFLTSFGSLFIGDATIESILDEPDYLINVSENKTQLIIEMFIAFFLASTVFLGKHYCWYCSYDVSYLKKA